MSDGPLTEVGRVQVLEALSCGIRSDLGVGVQLGVMASAPGEDVRAH